ncbi:MAG: hypothetical protein ABSG03_15680 [Bryobacteraceae bacterium]|jgi:hypothetical protein
MKWVIFAGGALFLLIALMALIGALLPVKHYAARKARFGRTPDAIYAVLAGPSGWRTDVKASGPLPEKNGRKQWWEQDKRGQKIAYELVEDSPPTRRVVRIADAGLPFGGAWTVEIAPHAAGGSEVRIAEAGEVYNVFFRFLSRFVFGYTGSIEAYLRDLGKTFGEAVDIEG